MFASKTTKGFYIAPHYGSPPDLIEITADRHAELLAGEARGMVIDWDASGGPGLVDPPPATREQVIAVIVSSVQAHLDDAAKSLNYDDIKTAVTYADEPAVPKFQADGQALRAWRSLVWAHAYATLDAVEDGEREQPTIEEFIAELPEFVLQYD